MQTAKGGNESLIHNTLIEEMFLRVANDDQMGKYVNLSAQGFTGPATAYASRIVRDTFFTLVETFEGSGGDIETAKAGKGGK